VADQKQLNRYGEKVSMKKFTQVRITVEYLEILRELTKTTKQPSMAVCLEKLIDKQIKLRKSNITDKRSISKIATRAMDIGMAYMNLEYFKASEEDRQNMLDGFHTSTGYILGHEALIRTIKKNREDIGSN
jgi:hypothetical protein